jgi:hypothetical protein
MSCMSESGFVAAGALLQVAGALRAPVGCGRVFYSDRRSESAGYLKAWPP